MSETDYLADERRRILAAALPALPFDGWNERLLAEAARSAGVEVDRARLAFPRGVVDLLEFHLAEADRTMLEAFEASRPETLKVRERIALAIRLRLEQQASNREGIRRALALLAQPQNAGLALKSLYRTVDAIWYAAGDTSTDFNFYTKRILLAGVYSATLLYWLDDKSEAFANTWAFLDRRIEDVMRVQRARGRLGRLAERLPNPFRVLRPRA